MFANCIVSGVYTTNTQEACFYQASHSEAEIIIVENDEHLKKYITITDKLPNVKAVIVYDDDASKLREKYSDKKNMILGWAEFLGLSDEYNEKKKLKKEVL